MKKYISEFIGTFTLVFIAAGAWALSMQQMAMISPLVIGLTLAAIYIAFAKISGAHFNPAVSLGALAAGRLGGVETVFYIIAQLLGSLVAAASVYAIAFGNLQYQVSVYGLFENGFKDSSLMAYPMQSALIFELIATFLFVLIFLNVTKSDMKKHLTNAGLAIGFFFAGAYAVGLLIDGGSLNPARSFGPAIVKTLATLSTGEFAALSQLPLFLIVPSIGGLLAGLAYRYLNADDDSEEYVEVEEIVEIEATGEQE